MLNINNFKKCLIFACVIALTVIFSSCNSNLTGNTGPTSNIALNLGIESRTFSSNGASTLVIKSDGSLWGWGDNSFGQLGNGGTGNNTDGETVWQTTPIKIMDDVANVYISDVCAFAIKTDGTLWAWGNNDYGQLGNGTTEGSTTPIKIMNNVVSVRSEGRVMNSSYIVAIKSDGTLWGWGSNSDGQLGNGGAGNYTNADSRKLLQTTPIKIMDNVRSVSIAYASTFVIRTDGSLWGLGGDPSGMFKDQVPVQTPVITPEKIMDDVKSISVGLYDAMIIKTDNSLWGCGAQSYSLVMHARKNGAAVGPVKIMDDAASIITDVDSSILVLKTDGSLWGWGYNTDGQLGNGGGGDFKNSKDVFQTFPIKIMDNVAGGDNSDPTMIIKTDGSLWSWGNNDVGQLGNGGIANYKIEDDFIFQTTPIKIMDDVKIVISVSSSAFVIKTDGSLWGWGDNSLGQLGNGGVGNSESQSGLVIQTTPIKIMDDVKG